MEVVEDITHLVRQHAITRVGLDTSEAARICNLLQEELDRYGVDVHYVSELGFVNPIRLSEALVKSRNPDLSDMYDVSRIPDNYSPVKKFKICLGARHGMAPNPVARLCNGLVYEISEVNEGAHSGGGTDAKMTDEKTTDTKDPDAELQVELVSPTVGVVFDVRYIERPQDYDIYEVDFGTTVHYYYDADYVTVDSVAGPLSHTSSRTRFALGRWIISSRNSAELNDKKFRGKTYEKVVSDVIAKYGFVPDEGVVYTFGYHHPGHHATADVAAWMIQTYDRKTGEVRRYPADLKIPTQRRVTAEAFKERRSEFGYIFRARDPDGGPLGTPPKPAPADRVLKTKKFIKVSRMVMQIKNNNRLERSSFYEGFDYTIMKNYLIRGNTDEFVETFPQFSGIVQRIEDSLQLAGISLVSWVRATKVKRVDTKVVSEVCKRGRTLIKQRQTSLTDDQLARENYNVLRNIRNIETFLPIFFDGM